MNQQEKPSNRSDVPTDFWQQYWQQRLEINCAFTQAAARAELARLDRSHEIVDDQNPRPASPASSPDAGHYNRRSVPETATQNPYSSEGRRQDENHSR